MTDSESLSGRQSGRLRFFFRFQPWRMIVANAGGALDWSFAGLELGLRECHIQCRITILDGRPDACERF